MPISLLTPAALTKLKIGLDLKAGSTKNFTGALEFEKEHDFSQKFEKMP